MKDKLPEVTSFKLFTDSFYKIIDQNGLLSEKIFGPVRSYRCACEKLTSKIIHENKTCDVCGVKCISNISRYNTFAKIILPFPVINKLKIKKFYKLVKLKNKHILDPIQNDRNTSINLYLEYNNGNLNTVDIFNSNCIPIVINSLFTLYLALKTIKLKYNDLEVDKYLDCFYDELLVIPPNSRQTIIMNEHNSNKLIMSDIDRTYIKIIKIKKYIEEKLQIDTKLIIEQYLSLISEAIDLEITTPIFDDTIIEINDLNSKIQYYCNIIYDLITAKLSGKEGLIRKSYMGISIDFSARAVIVPDASLNSYDIILPKKIFIKLFMPEYFRFLSIVKYKDNWKHVQTSNVINPVSKSLYNYLDDLEFIDEFVESFFKDSSLRQRLVVVNRQPSLWRYSLPAVSVIGICDEDVIKISPLLVSPLNAD